MIIHGQCYFTHEGSHQTGRNFISQLFLSVFFNDGQCYFTHEGSHQTGWTCISQLVFVLTKRITVIQELNTLT